MTTSLPSKPDAAADGIKMIALDDEDLVVLAAHLQDAVARVEDMTYQPSEKRFVALLNRFDRATPADPGDQGIRRRAALRIERVQRAQVQGIDLKDTTAIIAVLSILFEPMTDAPAGRLTVVCAGNAAIRLDVECIEVQVEDLGPAWAASASPRHDV